MLRALELARHGIALCSPNPVVGCVILDAHGALAGEGWHEYECRDHAEIVALAAAGPRARGGTAYVTLEPCNHTGRTGPCTQALIVAGIVRVVAATTDPNPRVAGSGLQAMRDAGIRVTSSVCEPAARRINEGFARWIKTRKPLVEMKVAMTLDGRIAPPPGMQLERQAYWITGEAARAAVQPMRWAADAVLTGVDTVLADDSLLTDRSGLPRRRPLLRVVLDSALRMPLDSRLVSSANKDLLVITTSTDLERRDRLTSHGAQVEVLQGRSSMPARVPLDQVLAKLGERQILTLLTETGTRLNTALLAGGFVDRIRVFVSPQIMGSDAVPAFRGFSPKVNLPDSEIERFADDFSVNSLIRDPWL